MTNETTASQPKSIGDDAQFRKLLNVVARSKQDHWSDMLIARIDEYFRAPAAQASATIQAAPELVQASRKLIHHLDARAGRPVEFTYSDPLIFAIRTALVAIERGATIQEPEMVAEPVEKAATKLCGRLLCLPQVRDGNNIYVTASAVNACVKEFLDKAPVAPMVADPAGVVPEAFKAAFLKWNGFHTEVEIAAEWAAHGGLCGTFFREGLAATVKAVPSEALAKRNEQAKFEEWSVKWKYNLRPANEGSADTYMEGETETAWMGWMACVDSFSAPLADKTGGGE